MFEDIRNTLVAWAILGLTTVIVLALIASFWAFISWDAQIYMKFLHTFNPVEHTWVRIYMVVMLLPSYYIKDIDPI